jgi:hypothetical protein
MRADECHEGDGYLNLDLRGSDIHLFPETFPGQLREACTAPKIRPQIYSLGIRLNNPPKPQRADNWQELWLTRTQLSKPFFFFFFLN